MPAAQLSPAHLHRLQGVLGLLLVPTLLLPWLRREEKVGGAVEWVPGWRLAGHSDLVERHPVPMVLAVLAVVVVLVAAGSAAVSWWRRSLGAAMLAALASLVSIFVVVGVSTRGRNLPTDRITQQVGPGLMLAVILCAGVIVLCLALLTTVKPSD